MHCSTTYLIGLLVSLTSCEQKKISSYDTIHQDYLSSSETKIKSLPVTPLSSTRNNNVIPSVTKSQPLPQSQTPISLELPTTPTPTIIQNTPEPIQAQQNVSAPNEEDISLEDRVKTYLDNHAEEIQIHGTRKKLIIYKQQHLIEIYLNDQKLKSYMISLGDFLGDKEKEGDNKTPEGIFYIAQKNPESKFYKALLLSYPTSEDAKRGENNGLISRSESESIKRAEADCLTPPQNTSLGSFIEIHGGRDTREVQDWTWGCIALKNAEMEEIYAFTEQGCSNGKKRTIIEIKP